MLRIVTSWLDGYRLLYGYLRARYSKAFIRDYILHHFILFTEFTRPKVKISCSYRNVFTPVERNKSRQSEAKEKLFNTELSNQVHNPLICGSLPLIIQCISAKGKLLLRTAIHHEWVEWCSMVR